MTLYLFVLTEFLYFYRNSNLNGFRLFLSDLSHDKMPAGVPSFNLINWKLYEVAPGQECLCVWTIDVLIWHSNYMLNDDTDSSGFPMG